ncbi:MAG TPA: carboxymuconolactone decarboxylase family protein [Polyangia bacterium]
MITIKTHVSRTRTRTLTALALVLTGALATASAVQAATPEAEAARADIERTIGFVPSFVKAIPDNALPGVWSQFKHLQFNGKSALPGKTKELIGLAIAAQMPSKLQIWSYTECAKASGASKAEIEEAVTMAAMSRHWSTFMNGIQLDETRFRAELAKLKEHVSKAAAAGTPPPAPLVVTDAQSALKDVQQSFGFVPEFLKKLPPETLPGAWLGFRNVEMNPNSALPGKTKSLISLAVASQVPCRYCIVADTEFAKLEGASDREITEAVAVAAIARQWIAFVEGLQIDEKAYRRDMERLANRGKLAARAAKAP